MAEQKTTQQTITAIRTQNGDLPIDYRALANKPNIDKSLTVSGDVADAKAVGDKISALNNSFVKNTVTINGKPLTSNITLTASDLGTSFTEHTHSASDINSGTLSMERGGTNAGNGSEGLKNLLAAGPMILTSGNQYGTQAQFDAVKTQAATAGQIFFVKVQ